MPRDSVNQQQPRAFISYSHADKAFVARLVNELKQLGVGVWIDEVELVIGDSLIERLGGAIGESDFLVAVISPHSVGSPWCQKELALAATQGIGQRRVKVLPVRLGGVDMPSFLQDAVWGDAALHTPEGLAAELALAMEHLLDLRGSQSLTAAGLPDGSPVPGPAQASPAAAAPRTSQAAMQPTSALPWAIEGRATTVPSSGRDADGFAWTLRRGDETRRIVVWISGSAMASSDSGLLREVVQAKQTKGRSVLGALLSQDSPPIEVLVSTYGVRWERVDSSGTGGEPASTDELPESREAEGDYRGTPGMPWALRLSLLKELRDLILESKNAARKALDNREQVTPRLIDIERRIRTIMKQLGDQEFPLELANFAGNAQYAGTAMSFWPAADAVVEKMIIDATNRLGQP